MEDEKKQEEDLDFAYLLKLISNTREDKELMTIRCPIGIFIDDTVPQDTRFD